MRLHIISPCWFTVCLMWNFVRNFLQFCLNGWNELAFCCATSTNVSELLDVVCLFVLFHSYWLPLYCLLTWNSLWSEVEEQVDSSAAVDARKSTLQSLWGLSLLLSLTVLWIAYATIAVLFRCPCKMFN